MQTDANLSWTGLRVRDFLSGERRSRCLHNECFHLDPPFKTATAAPRSASRSAIPRPIPREAPVTKANFP
jgi:hypothetical protein